MNRHDRRVERLEQRFGERRDSRPTGADIRQFFDFVDALPEAQRVAFEDEFERFADLRTSGVSVDEAFDRCPTVARVHQQYVRAHGG